MIAPLYILFIIHFLTYCKTSAVKVDQLICANHNFTNLYLMGNNAEDYCKVNKCIAKCCPLGQIIMILDGNILCNDYNATNNNYTNFIIHKNDVKNKIEVSDTITMKQFNFVYDPKFSNENCTGTMKFGTADLLYYIKENGELAIKNVLKHGDWTKYNALDFCIEYFLNPYDPKALVPIYYVLDTIHFDYTTVDWILTIGMLISSFFLFLTLVVYCLLPYLRNINGMIQMAYVGGVMIMFLLKYAMERKTENYVCYHVAPLYYFYIISNFLWLAVMSFNIWWTFRGTIKHRMVHRRGELMKFFVYCLLVYGTAAAPTIFATVIDRIDMSHWPDFQTPGFTACLKDNDGLKYYVYIPIGILISINCTLFIMTLYNIWKIKKGIEKFNSSETKKNQVTVSSFKIYAKLSVMMGVSWIVEVAQMDDLELPPTQFLLLNFYNCYIGVIIFILLISDKKKISMLCNRFNIKHKWIPQMQASSTDHSRSSASNKKVSKKEDPTFDTVELSSMDNNNRNNNITAISYGA